MSDNRKSEEDILFDSIKKDTEFNESTLRLAKVENNPARLETMLKGMQIGDKRELLNELRMFIQEDVGLKDDKKKEYLDIIKENEEIYNEIEEVILTKLGIEEIQYNIVGYEGVRDTTSNFRTSSEEIMLRANLNAISNTQRVLQEEFQTIEVTEENAEQVLKIINDVIDTSVNWLKYLKAQKAKGSFDLYKEEFWKLMDETIVESKTTLTVAEGRRQEIANEFPDIARNLDDKESEKNTRTRDSQDGDER